MLSQQEADELLSEPKLTNHSHIDLNCIKTVLKLHSKHDERIKFRLHITQSEKIELKLSCHHDFDSIPLLRIDFKGRHRNPETITDRVPQKLHPYTGKFFELNEPHIHIYVEGSGIDWALPIKEYGFKVSEINNVSNLVDAIRYFQDEINLETRLLFELPLISAG
ncbi:MAG: hypothetical protein HQK72_07460 [Desulfamplus sp.]|nr:hypothetical protein [Desulfamplus sp.]